MNRNIKSGMLRTVVFALCLASLGFDNRFHFPHAQTLAKMKALNISFYRTDDCGIVQINLPTYGKIKKPVCLFHS